MENTYYNHENNATINPKKIKAIKAKARGNMLGNYSPIIGATVLVYIIVYLVSGLLSPMIMYNPGPIQYAIYYVASFIITWLAEFFFVGISAMHLSAARGKKFTFAMLVYPVKNGTNRFLAVTFVLSIISFVASISSAFMMDKTQIMMYSTDYQEIMDASMQVVALSIVSIIISIICLVLMLALALSVYLLIDNPDMSAKEAMTSSMRYMKGNKIRLFLLSLSFIGLALLGILTLGLAYLWLIPYMEQSMVVFYEVVVQPEQSRPQEPEQPYTDYQNYQRPNVNDYY